MPLSCRVWTVVTPFLPDHQDTLLTRYSVYWTLYRVSSLAHTSSTTACHTCCIRICTGSTSSNASSTSWESQCTAVCSTRPQSTWSTAVHQSQIFPADVIYGQPLDTTWPYRITGQLVGPSLLQLQQSGTCYQTVSMTQRSAAVAENEPISSLPLSTHSAVEMFHDSVLYKSIIDIDITN